ncbi:hypothetical protein PC116_g12656 [Phytophthora cactorum]|uniref:Uncharacterized protein n=2 Tax=Phytophthora cactorum TaxID=29920 RepID=A0A329S633_9STRA|nr:hypothetical protein Pcac1_g15980 [Phytophthora cactorum]KAG2810868.1 hypothetical protein PC112_g15862 [Phytophthora cactorum]KAG2828425.1 hypothetical protein PC111_g8184 [Phytophthora cactorum]KAG2859112.1 hypothetical protein PC113_g9235 [Phytophthora cactorum]KAG2894799.1 hypothetical protein PC114_g15746 [Phytophthora cactorum]
MQSDTKPRASTQTPRFSYLLRLGLESIGVRYASIDLLRKAKKNQTTELEYWALWRLLHDLVLVILADFEVDSRQMEKMNNPETLKSALLDAGLHDIQIELVRFYLYEWGFVCTTFYSDSRPSSQVLLFAVAWLLAFSSFFEKQHGYILERCTGSKQPRLPPFPNDVDIAPACVQKAASSVVSTAIVLCEKKLPMDGQMHQLHSAFGRLQGHLNELGAYTRYHERLLKRLENLQNKPAEHQDELIPAYVLDLLAGPTATLAKQVQVLSQSVQMIEDEALFYKWINGLVLSLNNSGDSDSQVSPITAAHRAPHAALRAQVHEVQTLFQVHADSIQQIEQGYKQEWKKWTSRQKSRSQVQQMETKVERFTHDVQTRELFDPQKLFLRSQRSWETLNTSHAKNGVGQIHLATKGEVDRLQTQIASVISEITREYCSLQLR